MINRFCKGRHFKGYLSILILFVLSGFQSTPKQNTDIVLVDERLSITPKEFYIADVIDEREDKSPIGSLLYPVTGQNNQPKTYPADLHGGAATAVKQFIDHNLPNNKSLRPVIIDLKKLKVTETLNGAKVEGHVSLSMTFELNRDEDGPIHLADYNGTAVYTRSAVTAMDIGPTLRQVLENGLVYINGWMNKQAGGNIKLAKAIKLSFTDYNEKIESDTIYYSVNRPLTLDDFQSKPVNNRFDAEVFPTIGYDEHAEVKDGIVNLTLDIKVALPKSACWVRDASRTERVLNHEQRHFDIAKLAAEHFKQKIKAEELPVSNFEGYVNVDYLDAYREMNVLQKQYDTETNHGANLSAQQDWDDKIDKELKELGVK